MRKMANASPTLVHIVSPWVGDPIILYKDAGPRTIIITISSPTDMPAIAKIPEGGIIAHTDITEIKVVVLSTARHKPVPVPVQKTIKAHGGL